MECPWEETRYVYDGEGTLLKRTHKKVDPSAPLETSSTVYIGGIYEEQDDGTVVKYYHALGRAIAMRTVPASGPNQLHYLLSDHLGSTTKLLDDQGGVVSEVKYWPYGGMRDVNGTPATDKLYTGQQIEPSTTSLGLYNYKARFYSTTLGRFVSPDSLVVDGLNRYTYVRNNPMRYNDPTGRCVGGEMVYLWNPCTMEPAGYAPGTAEPLPMGPTVACAGLCQQLYWLGQLGLTDAELEALVLIQNCANNLDACVRLGPPPAPASPPPAAPTAPATEASKDPQPSVLVRNEDGTSGAQDVDVSTDAGCGYFFCGVVDAGKAAAPHVEEVLGVTLHAMDIFSSCYTMVTGTVVIGGATLATAYVVVVGAGATSPAPPVAAVVVVVGGVVVAAGTTATVASAVATYEVCTGRH